MRVLSTYDFWSNLKLQQTRPWRKFRIICSWQDQTGAGLLSICTFPYCIANHILFSWVLILYLSSNTSLFLHSVSYLPPSLSEFFFASEYVCCVCMLITCRIHTTGVMTPSKRLAQRLHQTRLAKAAHVDRLMWPGQTNVSFQLWSEYFNLLHWPIGFKASQSKTHVSRTNYESKSLLPK